MTPVPEKEEFGSVVEETGEDKDPGDRVPLGQHLTEQQQRQLRKKIRESEDIFNEMPGWEKQVIHKTIPREGKIVQEN